MSSVAKSFRPFLLLTLLCFAGSLAAQAAPSDAQMEQDVQLLLKNDDDVKELKRKLGAKEITNVDYTKQLNALKADRAAISESYDRASKKTLTSLYNAAKKDRSQAAAAAKATAAAEAKARAVEEKQAAQQAAAEKAAVEKEAARQAAAEKAVVEQAERKAAAERAAADAARAAEAAKVQAAAYEKQRTAQAWKFGIFVIAPFAGALIVPPLLIARRELRAKPFPPGSGPLHLPESLAMVKVLQREYPVKIEGGLIYDKDAWTHTSYETTTTSGSVSVSGNIVTSTPATSTTRSSSTNYARYWLRTLDGKETSETFESGKFPATAGHIISTISWERDMLLAYNHATGKLTTFSEGISNVHWQNPGWMLLLPVLLWGAVLWLLKALYGLEISGPIYGVLAAFGTALLIWVFSLKAFFQGKRNRQFERDWVPRFQKFLEDITPELKKRFATAETMMARGA